MSNPFWKSTRILLQYKRQLTLAMAGALLSAACFGAGLSMLLPMFHLMLAKGETIHSVIREYLVTPDRPVFVQDFGQWLIDLVPADPFWSFVVVMAAIAFFSIVGTTGRFFHQLLTTTVVHHAMMRLRRRIFRRMIHAPMIDVIKHGTADRISRFASDMIQMAMGYYAVLGKSAHSTLHGVAALLFAIAINWQLCALVAIGAPVLVILLRKFGKRMRRAAQAAMKERGRMIGALGESLNGLVVVKVHDAEGYERRRFARLNREVFKQEMKVRFVRSLSSPLVELLAMLGVMGVASVAAWMIFRQGHKPEEFMTALVMLVGAGASLKPVAGLHGELQESTAAAGRVMELLDLPVEPTGLDTPRGMANLPRHQRSIEFENVVFRYGPDLPPAVDGISLSVAHGQTVAIVGHNGSGKTSLLNLLTRLALPQSGRIAIDGQDIQQVRLRSLRKQMAVVSQRTMLFEGTIAQNIAYGRRHEPMEKIIAAAKAGHAHGFIAALPKGYDTMLGEHGVGLSGGQGQRIAIARAVLRDPSILILDEATSQIDAESEAEIARALAEISRGRTTFIIAHRLSTVVNSDLIVVMQAGRIIDQGRHDELLKRCDIYRTLVQTQLFAAAG